jgi:hypothetical protein
LTNLKIYDIIIIENKERKKKMIIYENFFFRSKKTFKTWKAAINFAYNDMEYLLDHEDIFSKKVVKKALEEFEDLVVCKHMCTEKDLHKTFKDGGIGCTGLYEISYIKED